MHKYIILRDTLMQSYTHILLLLLLLLSRFSHVRLCVTPQTRVLEWGAIAFSEIYYSPN